MSPSPAPSTLGGILERAAAADDFALTCAGRVTRAGELLDGSARVGGALEALGLRRGDRVAVMLRNVPEFLSVWFAIARLGLIEVAVHTEARGEAMRHVIDESGARVLVCAGEFVDRLASLALPELEHVFVAGGADTSALAGEIHELAELTEHEPARAMPIVAPDDVSCICYTSGTTGPAKGVVLGHRANVHLARSVVSLMDYTADDVLYTVFPLSHVNAKFTSVLAALDCGADLVLDDRFSASGHWDRMRAHGVTAFNYMGALLAMLAKQPERDDDADHAVTRCYGAACAADLWPRFEARFGVALFEHYGMTETGVTTRNTATERRVGSCGRPADYYEVRIAGDDGHEVARGEVGEIQIRPRLPGIMLQRYWERADATIAASRDFWFHTGDRARMDEDGFCFFADRAKDSIRRRGENISSWDVESAVNEHPAVLESAAYGVPDEVSEEEVMIAIVLQPGASLTPEEVVEHCTTRLARFAIPRYVAFRDALPKNQNQRIQKFILREAGVPAGTFDRAREQPPDRRGSRGTVAHETRASSSWS